MAMNIFEVNKQWSNRPADETFDNLSDAYSAALQYAKTAVEKADVNPSTLRVEAGGKNSEELVLVGKGNIPAVLTNWAFGQLTARVGAPKSYLSELPATLAAQNLNFGLRSKYGSPNDPTTDEKVNLLVHENGKLLLRAFNSEKYSRIWNYELLARLVDLQGYGWHNPRPFNKEAEVGTVWVSDHDMFVFQVNDSNLIEIPGPDGVRQLRRGFIMSNSEVGAAKWRTMTFLFDFMCANRIVWGAENVTEINVRHVGSAADRLNEVFQKFSIEIKKYAESSATDEEAKIEKARSTVIATSKNKVVDKVFSLLKGQQISRKAIEESYDTAIKHPDSDVGPTTPWGLAQGFTRYSQSLKHMDQRILLDKAAGKLVELAF